MLDCHICYSEFPASLPLPSFNEAASVAVIRDNAVASLQTRRSRPVGVTTTVANPPETIHTHTLLRPLHALSVVTSLRGSEGGRTSRGGIESRTARWLAPRLQIIASKPVEVVA
ncbi:hypothetical protein MRX96_001888 [Rhipicephalus microplus]